MSLNTVALICLLGAFASDSSATGLVAQDSKTTASSEQTRRVILLTGFEPFGEEKKVNSSWEGIKGLDGVHWKEFDLVAKELPVIWGAPYESMGNWISEYKPVAILSFGQGSPRQFAIESVAHNRRGQKADNDGSLPPNRDVIAKGPPQFGATIDSYRMARALTAAGFPTAVSKEAGRYLCEETLYTLEYLRQKNNDEVSVMFCHVPPIGTELGSTKIDGAYVQKFVMRTLEEWRTVDLELKADLALAESLIRRYFKVWSDQDMQAYGSCFSKHASIHSIDQNGNISLSSLKPFVEGQTKAHKNAASKMIEVPEEIVMRREGRLIRAIVHWKLTSDNRVDIGYDHFTLCKEGGQWKIVNLVFYGTE